MEFSSWAPWAGVTVTAVGSALGAFYRAHTMITDLRTDLSVMRSKMDERFYNAREERLGQITETKSEIKAYSDANRRAVDMQILAVLENLQKFQLRVLDEFVRTPALKDCEGRIMASLDRLAEKVDRIHDRGNVASP